MNLLSPDDARFGAAAAGDAPPAPPTYYGAPLLKRPEWEWEVVTYLFLGGVMGGSGMLVALADGRDAGDRVLIRNARYVAFTLAATCPVVLIAHLGRPERFHHMLRVVKFKSVMSMGVWGLIAFSLPATLAAAGELATAGIIPRPLARLAPASLTTPALLLLGAFLSGYTGVLLSATAIPVWALGKRFIPAFSVCSGIAAACALHASLLQLSSGTERTTRKLERLELVASLAELVLLQRYRAHAGETGEVMFAGAVGTRVQRDTILGGIIVPSILNLVPVESKLLTVAAGVLTLLGAFSLRRSLIDAGKDSADDPKPAFRQPE